MYCGYLVAAPPDQRIEQPPESATEHSDKTCQHCPDTATLRFNGHHPDKLLTAGKEPCLWPLPYRLCSRCYVAWFRHHSTAWYRDGHGTCGECGATGKTIEDLVPFDKIP